MCFFFQAEDGIRDLVRSRGLGDVYKRQPAMNFIRGKADGKGRLDAPGLASAFNTNVHLPDLSLIHI